LKREFGLLIACSFLAFGTTSFAEQADRTKPINIEANSATADQTNRVRTLEGNVILVQGTMRLSAARMIVKEDEDGFVTAQIFGGPSAQVAFRQKREGAEDFMEGFADRAEFDDRNDTLKLFSKARLKNGGDELKGEYIFYNSATEVVQARSAIPDGKSTTDQSGGSGRVNFTIQPRVPEAGKSAPKSK
jgi:lipopolysaccharide export system protein LptA